jgi:hypothetical protein
VSDFEAAGRVRRLGFAVKVLGDGGLASHDTRRWQSGPHLSRSLERVEAILRYPDRKDTRMYRQPSGDAAVPRPGGRVCGAARALRRAAAGSGHSRPDARRDGSRCRGLGTWPAEVVPKIHYSSPRLDVDVRRAREGRRVRERIVIPPLRAHADRVDPVAFEAFLRGAGPGRAFDVMLEAKAKDLALLELRNQLARSNS